MKNKLPKLISALWLVVGLVLIGFGLVVTIEYWGLITSGFWYVTALCSFTGLCGLVVIMDTIHDMNKRK